MFHAKCLKLTMFQFNPQIFFLQKKSPIFFLKTKDVQLIHLWSVLKLLKRITISNLEDIENPKKKHALQIA